MISACVRRLSGCMSSKVHRIGRRYWPLVSGGARSHRSGAGTLGDISSGVDRPLVLNVRNAAKRLFVRLRHVPGIEGRFERGFWQDILLAAKLADGFAGFESF